MPGSIVQEEAGSPFGYAIAGASDVDADGFPDVIIGAAGDTLDERPGRAYVVFRPSTLETIALGEHEGLTIVGAVPGHRAGSEVGGVGDVNGDGFGDLLVEAHMFCQPTDPNCSHDCDIVCSEGPERTYLVHGRAEPGKIELGAVAHGVGGFTIEKHRAQSFIPLGDLNGDQLADFAIAEDYGINGYGRVHVIFGKKDTAPVLWDALELGQGGYVIIGESAYDGLGLAARAAGDVNGDGLQDLVLGARYAEDNIGRAYVVFGKATTTPIRLTDVAAGKGGGFAIIGDPDVWNPETGSATAPAGDINGDGLADVAVSAAFYDNSGRAYIVLGKTDAVPVHLKGFTSGVVITSSGSNDFELDGDGSDLDGDGFADLLVGRYGETARVSGAAPGTTVMLGGPHAPTLDREGWETLLPILGDLDCDGRTDLGYFYKDGASQIRLDYVFGG